jgi:hypothetical protein
MPTIMFDYDNSENPAPEFSKVIIADGVVVFSMYKAADYEGCIAVNVPDYDTFITLFDGAATIIDHPPVSPGVVWNGVEFDYQEEGLGLEEIIIPPEQADDAEAEIE